MTARAAYVMTHPDLTHPMGLAVPLGAGELVPVGFPRGVVAHRDAEPFADRVHAAADAPTPATQPGRGVRLERG